MAEANTHYQGFPVLSLTSILNQYVNRKANVLISDGTVKTGWIYTVDPVTGSIVLIQNSENGTHSSCHLNIICGHAVKQVELLEETLTEKEITTIESLLDGVKQSSYSQFELNTRKVELKEWLERNRIPVQEFGAEGEILSIMGVLYVDPPYNADCCRSNNEIILDRIQKLIGAKPVQ